MLGSTFAIACADGLSISLQKTVLRSAGNHASHFSLSAARDGRIVVPPCAMRLNNFVAFFFTQSAQSQLQTKPDEPLNCIENFPHQLAQAQDLFPTSSSALP